VHGYPEIDAENSGIVFHIILVDCLQIKVETSLKAFKPFGGCLAENVTA
jgi:hypothetical protein